MHRPDGRHDNRLAEIAAMEARLGIINDETEALGVSFPGW
jgi:hypothetical protein